MIYQITYQKNEKGRLRKVAAPVKDRAALMALRNGRQNIQTLERVRGGDATAKRHLLQLAYNLGHVEGELAGTRSIGSFFFHDVDAYGGERPMDAEAAKALILARREEIGLVMLERSVSGGWHLVCRRRPGTTILENQVRVATVLRMEMDTSAKDLQRVAFSTSGSADDLVFLDDVLFTEPMTAEECQEEYNRLRGRAMRREERVPEGARHPNKHYRPWEDNGEKPEEGQKAEDCQQEVKAEAPAADPLPAEAAPTAAARDTFRGIPYATIIRAWWPRVGGEPVEGERNVKLYQLAAHLRAICDNRAEVLLRVMPRLGLDEAELRAIVESACKETPKGISKTLAQAIADAEARQNAEASTADAADAPLPLAQGQGTGADADLPLEAWGEEIEGLFGTFPLLADVCKGLKRSQYPAALFVGGGLLMTLMTRCTYRFYHRPEELRRLNNCTLIIGDPASGKSFATRLYRLLTAPIAQADEVGKEAINAYREQMKTKGANKEKPKRPKVAVRIHPARTSNAQFIQDMVNSVEEVDGQPMQLHMLTFDTELDNTLTVQRGGSWIDKQSMELKAFHNEEDGQAYSNVDSILQNFNVTWNFIYTGTPIALKKKVNTQNFGSGMATRLSVIPLPATGFEMMARQQHADTESDARLSTWATRLDRTKGELPLADIVDNLYAWTARRMADAADNDSRADEMLLKRCAYHGLNFAAPFIVMRHWKEVTPDGSYFGCGRITTDATDWQLAELIVNIQYACQRHFFGHLAEEYFEQQQMEASVNGTRRTKTLNAFAELPREFTVEDVMRCFHLKTAGAAYMRIQRLTADNLIRKLGTEPVGDKSHRIIYAKTGVLML